MAQDQVPYESANSARWTLLTDSNVTAVTFGVNSGAAYIRGTNGTSEPSATAKGHAYRTGEGETNMSMAAVFLGISANRLWMRPIPGSGGAEVIVSHA